MHETPSRDRGDGRATRSAGACVACRATTGARTHKVRDPRTPGRTAISAVAAGGSCITRVNKTTLHQKGNKAQQDCPLERSIRPGTRVLQTQGSSLPPAMGGARAIHSANPHSRINTQAGPAARQAEKEIKRERIRICPTACISHLARPSRSERSEGMRFASQTTRSPAAALSVRRLTRPSRATPWAGSGKGFFL
jgi:hypothetical protein